MALSESRKSTAPPPPPVSTFWDMPNNAPSYPNSEQSSLMNDDEFTQMAYGNGHHSNDNDNTKRNSVTKSYKHPKPPIHATVAILSPSHNYDHILKNNPYEQIDDIQLGNSNRFSYDNDTSHESPKYRHHRKESDTINAFLKSRPNEAEFKKRLIFGSDMKDTEDRDEYLQRKFDEKEKIKSRLQTKLSDKFRPAQEELFGRGIYQVDPKQDARSAAWLLANQRRRNSRTLARKFVARPSPMELVERGLIREKDYNELFGNDPQTQPPTPEVEKQEINHSAHYNNINHSKLNNSNNKTPKTKRVISTNSKNKDFHHFDTKLSRKIRQRPTIKEMRERNLMIDDPTVPASLQNRKRLLHRRRASQKLEHFLARRPKIAQLKQRHIMVSPKEHKDHQIAQRKVAKHIKQRPSMDFLVKKHIFIAPGSDSSRPVYKGNNRKSKKGVSKVWVHRGGLVRTKRRESMEIDRFLQRRPKAEQLVANHILPSMPERGYNEIKNDFEDTRRQNQSRLNRNLTKKMRPKWEELQNRGVIPQEYDSRNHDWDTAKFKIRRKRAQSRTDLQKQLQHRPPIKHLLDHGIIDPLSMSMGIENQDLYRKRRNSQKLDFANALSHKFESRPEIDNIPVKYFMPGTNNHKHINNTNSNDNDGNTNIGFSVVDDDDDADDDDKFDSQYTMANTNLTHINPFSSPIRKPRRRVHSKSQESLILEQFLPVRPEIALLWEKNILPSLPPSPHKNTPYHSVDGHGSNVSPLVFQKPSLFKFQHSANSNNSGASSNLKALQLASPHIEDIYDEINNNHMFGSPITPQKAYIDKRRQRRQDSMLALESKLNDRVTRESLFEIGILIMSPAPSPPPLSVIQQQHELKPLNTTSLQEMKPHYTTPQDANFDFGSIFRSELEANEKKLKEDLMRENNKRRSQELKDKKKKRKFIERKYMSSHNNNNDNDYNDDDGDGRKKEKTNSMVLKEYLGDDLAAKLDLHLFERPSQEDLVSRGVVPDYAFDAQYTTAQKFGQHRRNQTMELQQRLEKKLAQRPLFNDLPNKIYAVHENLDNLRDESKISEMEKNEIIKLLHDMKIAHEKGKEDLKARYWSMLVEQKDAYRALSRVSMQNEIMMRQKLEAMSSQCQHLSNELIAKNNEMAEQRNDFGERLQRSEQQYREQIQRQENRLKLADDSIKQLRELQRANSFDNERGDTLNINFGELTNEETKSKILTIERHFKEDLEKQRSMHRKIGEHSERVKQTLVDEINKMEQQHRNKLIDLENEIATLKEINRTVMFAKENEMTKLNEKMSSEISKEREITTITVEVMEEEKAKLVQEMNELREEYDTKLEKQKQQIGQLRSVAEDALSYGNQAVNNSGKMSHHQKHRSSIDMTFHNTIEMEEKDKRIKDLRAQLNKQNKLLANYNKMKQSKKYLEQQVLLLSKRIMDTFNNGLNDDAKRKLNLKANRNQNDDQAP